MSLTVNNLITLGLAVISVATFVLNRKDKAVKDSKESNFELINYRLNQLDENVKKILAKLENYDVEMEQKIDKALQVHIKEYHKRLKNE